MRAFESVSTWRQPVPPPASAERTALIAEVRPRARADVIVDNRDFTRPAIIGPPAGR